MNPSVVRLQLATAVADGICQSQSLAAAGNLTINGSLATGGVATMDVARRVLIGSDADDSVNTFTVYGTDTNGNVQSESLTGPTAATDVYTVLDYKTVTRVAVGAATVGNVTVGTNGVGSTAWIMCNWMDWVWAAAVACSGPVGTTYTVEHTYDDFTLPSQNMPYSFSLEPGSNVPAKAWPNPVIQSASGDSEVRYSEWPIFGIRLTMVSGTGEVTMQVLQAGRGSGPA